MYLFNQKFSHSFCSKNTCHTAVCMDYRMFEIAVGSCCDKGKLFIAKYIWLEKRTLTTPASLGGFLWIEPANAALIKFLTKNRIGLDSRSEQILKKKRLAAAKVL